MFFKKKKSAPVVSQPQENYPAEPVAPVMPVEPVAPAAPVAPAPEEIKKEEPCMVEEYAEAYLYEGGPIEGVEMAEEVNPTVDPLSLFGHANTAGYDFYNSKSFDPFIATLNDQERNEFTELFILKYKGVMPEIPDYQVGGDNREFFRRIFIYLGQYRERISAELLSKMYTFSIKTC